MSDDELNRGLEGVLVAETRLSGIDGEAGELTIGGFDLAELAANATFEETVYLLWHDRLPDADELAAFRADLAGRRAIDPETRELLRAAAAAELPAMDALRMGAASASLAAGGDDERSEGGDAEPEVHARTAVARLPTVGATYWRYRQGADPVAPDASLSHAANYLYMLTGERPADPEVRGLETYLNSVVDHGLNASTFTARAIVSTESDVLSAVTGAIGSLKGPLHGGAPGPVLEMLRDVHERLHPEEYVRAKLEAGDRLMGFGHRVYRVRDPRAAVLQAAAERFYERGGDRAFFESAREFEDVAVEQLERYKPDARLDTNVEFYTAVLLNGIGIPKELFTATFGIARVGGWTAHCLEQLEDNRLVRPRGRYVGDRGRTWTPVAER